MSSRRFAVLSLLLSAGVCAWPALATVPAGFTDTLLISVGNPTALAFTPDGRLLITTQDGTVRIFQSGALLPAAALTLGSRVCSNNERGLLGVAVDPAFATNRYIYLFYTFNKSGVCSMGDSFVPVERISRYTLLDTNVISPASELVLVDNVLNFGGNHNGGDVHFGADGYLYASIGDGGCDYAGDSGCAGANDASRDTNILNGKILRIASDGSIPPSNPFLGAGTARCNTGPASPGMKCQETFAWGFRNPFRFVFRPGTSQFYVNDVGQDTWEEIDAGQAGADYGWNCREGAHTNSTTGKCSPAPPNMVEPIFNYQHNVTIPGTSSSGCNAITGGAFVPVGVWPPSWDGAYLFGDFVCGAIFRLSGSGPFSATDFATSLGAGSAVDMIFGPYNASQSLYYTAFDQGEVHRIDYVGGPQPGRTFYTLAPCRAVDTRNPAGTFGGPALAAGGSRDFPLAGRCGVPSDAVAVSANVTVVTPASAGFLQIAPTGIYSEVSTINFPAGKTRANNGILSLQGSPAGSTTIGSGFPAGTCDFIVDVNGYFR